MEKRLDKLLVGINYKVLNGDANSVVINKICYDSKTVEKDDLFVCLKGARFDSHTVISSVVDAGAKVIVVEIENESLKDALINPETVVIAVKNSREALAYLSKNYFEDPAKNLKIIGITGTKGKTTTAFMVRQMLEEDGLKTGMIGTIGIFYDGKHILTNNTTPESYILYESFYNMKEAGCTYVVMEVSSQSLKHHRVDGIHFFYAMWTNIMPEHIGKDEHDDFDDYLNSKLKIFSQCDTAVVNADTEHFDDVVNECKKHRVGINIKSTNKDLKLMIPGDYNIENASLAYRLGVSLGISERIINHALMHTVVPGRCELVYEDNNIKVFVDYSYEPSGAKKFLETISPLPHKRIVTVFGCGGNRSIDRRTGMGEVAGKLADFVILTADNSRWEKTIDIIKDIESTLTKYKKKDDIDSGYIIREDRREAIEYAIEHRRDGDIICVMGKGHEPLSEANGIKTRFLDKEEVLKAVEKFIR